MSMPCDICHGQGFVKVFTDEQCVLCDGTGRYEEEYGTCQCPKCHGKGSKPILDSKVCYECNGTGYITF